MSAQRKPEPSSRGLDGRTRLATELRAARAASGLTGTQAGRAAGMGQSKVSKLERATLLPSPDDVQALARAYGMPAKRRNELIALAQGLRDAQSSRLSMSRRVGEMQHRLGKVKRTSSLIRGFQPTMVFGLLQTPAYAACVFGQRDSRQLDPAQADEAVEERLAQQGVLDDPTKEIRLVMTEGALRWHAGSAAIMAEQIDAIAAAVARRPHLRIGVIPWTRPVDVFTQHSFHIYDDTTVVFGTATATAFLTGKAEVAVYAELFDSLEEVAVYGDDAREHLLDLAGEYRELDVRSRR